MFGLDSLLSALASFPRIFGRGFFGIFPPGDSLGDHEESFLAGEANFHVGLHGYIESFSMGPLGA